MLLADLRPVPSALPAAATLAIEGATYNWLWDIVRNLYAYGPCSRPLGGRLDFLVPPGWAPLGGDDAGAAPGVYNLPQGRGARALPFMVMLRKVGAPGAGHVVVVLRGTNTESEWVKGARGARRGGGGGGPCMATPQGGAQRTGRTAARGPSSLARPRAGARAHSRTRGRADFSYARVANVSIPGVEGAFPGEVHGGCGRGGGGGGARSCLAPRVRGHACLAWLRAGAAAGGPAKRARNARARARAPRAAEGFADTFRALWPPVLSELRRQLAAGGAAHVSFAGHSLGAGAAALLSFAAARLVAEAAPAAAAPPPPVTSVLFACPNVGDAAFVAAHAAAVNSRRVVFAEDVVPLIPCASAAPDSGMPACAGAPVRTASRWFEWKAGGRRAWGGYQPLAGTVAFGGGDMPAQRKARARGGARGCGHSGGLPRCNVWEPGTRPPARPRAHLPARPPARAAQQWAAMANMRLSTVMAAHTCSYSCKLSSYSAGDTATRCLLAPEADAAVAASNSFCPGFPLSAACGIPTQFGSLPPGCGQ